MPIISSNYSVYENRTQRFSWLTTPQDKDLLFYATSMGRESWKQDYFMRRSDINIYMINYIVRGSCNLKADGKEIRLHQGDLTFLHLVTPHEVSAVEDGTEIIYFHFLGGQTAALYNAYLEKGDFVLHNVPESLPDDCFKRYAAAVDTENGFYEQSRILYFLLTEILRLRRTEAQNKYPKFIERVLCHILYRCPPPTPTEVAKEFGFSPVYLERMFKKYVGTSMQVYILKQKYAFACRFLTDTDMSVTEIARKVGYEDSKGLIVLFKKFGDLTPLAYRKAKREKQTKKQPVLP